MPGPHVRNCSHPFQVCLHFICLTLHTKITGLRELTSSFTTVYGMVTLKKKKKRTTNKVEEIFIKQKLIQSLQMLDLAHTRVCRGEKQILECSWHYNIPTLIQMLITSRMDKQTSISYRGIKWTICTNDTKLTLSQSSQTLNTYRVILFM